jgi:hypothetical protein
MPTRRETTIVTHNFTRMKRSNSKVQRLGIWDAVAISLITVALWYLLWAFAGIIFELNHFLNLH